MISYENECVGCPPEMGCLGSNCPNRNVRYLYCDKCSWEADKLYAVNGYQLCKECAEKMLFEDFVEEVIE